MLADEIEALVAREPGLTEREIATELFGDGAYQQRVNSTCRKLIGEKRVRRQGFGGVDSPYRYVISAPGQPGARKVALRPR